MGRDHVLSIVGQLLFLLRWLLLCSFELFQKLLLPEKEFQIRKVDVPTSGTLGGRIRMQVVHVDINCQENETGYTPLIIAVLNGIKVPKLISAKNYLYSYIRNNCNSLNKQTFSGIPKYMFSIWIKPYSKVFSRVNIVSLYYHLLGRLKCLSCVCGCLCIKITKQHAVYLGKVRYITHWHD